MLKLKSLHKTLVLSALIATAVSAVAQNYPNQAIKLQVPFAHGGTTDIIARVLSDPLGKALGNTVIMDNK